MMQKMMNKQSISFHVIPESYGEMRVTPLLIANELNSKLERWFQNCKFSYLAISNLSEEAYNEPLQLEYSYSRRILPQRDFKEVKSSIITEIDLLNYHQLVKIIHEFIEKIHRLYLSLKEKRKGDNILSFEKHINKLCDSYQRKGFPEKLDLIEKNLELELPLDHLKCINRVRNCLEHRSGIVGEKDCDKGKNYMSIHWRYPKIESAEGELSPLSNIKGKSYSEVSFDDETKKFYKGKQIEFDFYDNSKGIYTLNMCFKEIIDAFYKLFEVDQNETPAILREFKSV